MKRKAEADESAPQSSPEPERGASRAKAKRPRIQDAQSVRQQAVRYQLATAKMPLEALTCTWKHGTNRQLNRQHVSRLCRMFRQGTLARQSEEHFLLVQCSSAAAQRMLDRQSEQEVAQKEGEVLSFDDWLMVNGDEKAEVMAGQHRIEALREYVKETGSGSKDLWWTCILYDEATLPPELNVQLRVNRRDPTLPDSHGQIWTQLVLAAGQDSRLFCGKKEDVKAQMLDVLRLSSEDRFPLGRLVTLWNNDRWRSMITRWCESELGRATFNISTLDWMASYRIDNYWFSTFERALATLKELPGSALDEVHAQDWAKLAALPQPYSQSDASRLFYPTEGEAVNAAGLGQLEGRPRRRKGFLQEVSDEDYQRIYARVASSPLPFPDIRALLKTSKDEGRVMMQVMTHVVAWLNPEPFDAKKHYRKNNKPLLREDLKPEIRKALRQRQGRRAEDAAEVATLAPLAGSDEEEVEALSITLERQVLDRVRLDMAFYKSTVGKASVDTLLSKDADGYGERFIDSPWKDVLHCVKRTVISFRSPWDVVRGDQPAPGQTRGLWNTCSITRSVASLTRTIPEVAANPALSSHEASQELCAAIDKAVVMWLRADVVKPWTSHLTSASSGPPNRYNRSPPPGSDMGPSREGSLQQPSSTLKQSIRRYCCPASAVAESASGGEEEEERGEPGAERGRAATPRKSRHVTAADASARITAPKQTRPRCLRRASPLPSSPGLPTPTAAAAAAAPAATNGSEAGARGAPALPPPPQPRPRAEKLNTLHPSGRHGAPAKHASGSHPQPAVQERQKVSRPSWSHGPVAVSSSE